MIDPTLKQKWIAALRSGKYLQTRKRLRSRIGNGLCCLGVLCRVAGIPLTRDGGACGPTRKGRNQDYWPIHALIGKYETGELMRKNDCDKLSFPEIADWIERNLPPRT